MRPRRPAEPPQRNGAVWGVRATAAVRVEVTVPRSRGHRERAGITIHRLRRAPAGAVRDGIPVTTPTQTLIDLSSVLPRPALERALEAAETLHLLDVARLPPKLADLAGRIDPRLRSPLEADLRALIDARALPRPRVNATVEGL